MNGKGSRTWHWRFFQDWKDCKGKKKKTQELKRYKFLCLFLLLIYATYPSSPTITGNSALLAVHNLTCQIYRFCFRLCHRQILVLILPENHPSLRGCGWLCASLCCSLANCNSMSMRPIIWPALAWALPRGEAWKQSALARGWCPPPPQKPLMPTSSVINNIISAKVDFAGDNVFPQNSPWMSCCLTTCSCVIRQHSICFKVMSSAFADVHLTASRERLPACSSLPSAIDKLFMSSSWANSNLVTLPVLPSTDVLTQHCESCGSSHSPPEQLCAWRKCLTNWIAC